MMHKYPCFKRLSNPSGMTLIEVMIAMALLAFLSVAVYQTTVGFFSVNKKLSGESSDFTTIALSLSALEADFSQIFTPIISQDDVPTQEEAAKGASQYWGPILSKSGLRRMRFKGDKEKVSFITNNNRRVQKNSAQSDFQKIFWEIDRSKEGTFTLYRTTDTNAFTYSDNNTDKKPIRVPILENLFSAKFRYYRRTTKSWEENWDSESSYVAADARYPDLIELKVEVPDPVNTANPMSWTIKFKPNNPLNILTEAQKEARKNAEL